MARSIDALFGGDDPDEEERAEEGGRAPDEEPEVREDLESPSEGSSRPRPHSGIESADPFMDMEVVPSRDDPEEDDAPEASSDEGAAGGAAGSGASAEDAGGSLEEAVDRYLAAEGPRREDLARTVREQAAASRDADDPDPVADAVERLAMASEGDSLQDAPVALARLLTTPGVAGRLTARLGAAREEGERERRVEIASRLGEEMAIPVGEALSETEDRSARRAYMEALVALGDEGMEVVVGMIDDPRWFVVRNGVHVLGEIGGEQSVQHLTTALAHDHPRVRREALLALAKIGGENAEMLVPGKLEDPDDDVRAAAAMAAGALEIEKAGRPLLALLDREENPDVQVEVLRALGQLGDPGAVSAIEKRATGSFFSRPSTEVRIAAYRALAAIGTPHARKILEEGGDDRDPEVASAVRKLLKR